VTDRYTLPHHPRLLRLLALLVGAVVFVWMGFEDNHLWPVLVLGTVFAGVLVALWASSRWGDVALSAQWFALLWIGLGALTGLSASVTTMLLMLFKNARHGHLFPDYPTPLLGDVLARAPVWMLAGALVGLSVALLVIGLRVWHEDAANQRESINRYTQK
jgi:hypothetical protein